MLRPKSLICSEQAIGQSIAMAETVEDMHREVAWRANATRDQLAAAANS